MIQDQYTKIWVKTWHLFFDGQLPSISNQCELFYWKNPESGEYLSLYNTVGSKWGWCGRLLLTPEELEKKLNSPENEVWLFKTEGVLRGFFEIDRSKQGEAEIVYLGLLPEEIGKGFGQIFLDSAITIASGTDNKKVWLHTCEYDHPKALSIYLKAGLVVAKETIENEYYSVEFLERIKKSR
jgi:hypothetical protein